MGVEKYCNRLPASVVTAPSVNIFKKVLEKVWTENYAITPMMANWNFLVERPQY